MFVTKKEFEDFKEKCWHRELDHKGQIGELQMEISSLKNEVDGIKSALGIKSKASGVMQQWYTFIPTTNIVQPTSQPTEIYECETTADLYHRLRSLELSLGVRYDNEHTVPAKHVKLNNKKRSK